MENIANYTYHIRIYDMIRTFIKKLSESTLVACIGSVLILLILFFWYASYLQYSIIEETQLYLHEITKQTKQGISRQLQDRLSFIINIANLLSEDDLKDPDPLLAKLAGLKSMDDVKRFGILFPDGSLHTSDKAHFELLDRAHAQRAFSGESGISATLNDRTDGQPISVYYAPIFRQQTVVGMFFMVSPTTNFSELLYSDFFQNNARASLVYKNGDIIQTSDAANRGKFSNIFEQLEAVGAGSSITPHELLENMSNGKSGRYDYVTNGEHRYVFYTPLDINDWYLFSVVSATEIDRRTMERFLWTFAMVGAVIFLLGLVWFKLVNREKRYKKALVKNMEELRNITANIPGGVLRCQNDEWMTMDYVSDGFVEMTGYTRAELESIFCNKFLSMLHSDDLFPTLRRIEEQLSAGNSIDLEFRLIRSDGSLFWAHQKGVLMCEGTGCMLYCVLVDETDVRTAMDIVHMDAARYAVLFKMSDSILFEFDMRSGQLATSPKFQETFGYACPTTRFPQSLLDAGLVHTDDVASFTYLFDALYSGEVEAESEIRIQKADRTFLWCRVQVMGILDQNNICTKSIGKIIDIDSQMRELLKLKEEIQRDPFTQLYNKVATEHLINDAIASGQPGALFLVDVDNFKRINDQYGHAAGDSVLLSLATRLQGLFRKVDIVGRIGGDEFAIYLNYSANTDGLREKAEAICRIFSLPIEHNSSVVMTVSGSVGGALFPSDAKDYSTLFTNADKAMYESKRRGKNCATFYCSLREPEPTPVHETSGDTDAFDALTGIFTERIFEENGEHIVGLALEQKKQLAVIAMMVQGLQRINTTVGYAHGDAVLVGMVAAVRRCLPEGALFARCKGNDFGIILPLVPERSHHLQITSFLTLLRPALEADIPDVVRPWTKIQMGVALCPEHGDSLDPLYRKARQALENCKGDRLLTHEIYDEVAMKQQRDAEELKLDLMTAGRHNELELYFQPQVDRQTGRICSIEALLRWNHKNRGQLLPDAFIPLAEESLFMPTIDNWVINAACEQWRSMADEGIPVVPMAVNISSQKFFQENLWRVVSDALIAHNMPPSMLVLEINEKDARENPQKTAAIMQALRAQGLRISLDNFGTGCTLNDLNNLPLDIVKLDRSFIEDADENAAESLSTLIDLIKAFKATVIVEGIATEEQYTRCSRTACDLMQGYLTAPPMERDEVAQRLLAQG